MFQSKCTAAQKSAHSSKAVFFLGFVFFLGLNLGFAAAGVGVR